MDLFKRSNYNFHLPESLIAAYPLEKRSDARLMVLRKKTKTIEHRYIHELPSILPAQSVLVANNTKVFRARLLGTREASPGKIEFFLLKKIAPLTWQGLIRSSAKVTPGFRFGVESISAEVLERVDTNAGTIFTVKLSADPVEKNLGEVPLPPYIVSKRASDATQNEQDELTTYNTVFASQTGSVAAPTAGRHFTPELIEELKSKQIGWEEITLHVGLGTFKPVMADDIREHQMHPEVSFISDEVSKRLNEAKQKSRPIIAVGTTSTRTLEGRGDLKAGEQDVNLFIHPGSHHHWRWVDGMLTNFHLPESTLLMMVADFLGDLEFLKSAYAEAVQKQYRFYSYGDAMLILPE